MLIWGLPEGQTSPLWILLLCILRVPGLMLVDVWWVERAHLSVPSSLSGEDLGEMLINAIIIFMSLSVLLLPLVELVELYMHLVALGLLFAAHSLTHHFLNQIDNKPKYGLTILGLVVLSYGVNWCLAVVKGRYAALFPGLYVLPVLLRLGGLNPSQTQWSIETLDVFMGLTTLFYSLSALPRLQNYLLQVMDEYWVEWNQLGNHNFLILVVQRSLQPPVMVLYWTFLFTSQVWSNYMQIVEKKYLLSDEGWYIEAVVAMSEVCESPLILISFCTSIMVFSKSVMEVLTSLFSVCGAGQVGGDNPLANTGFSEGIVAFVLALQTGLIDLDMPQKVGATSIILFVVAGSLIQSAFEVSGPVLLALPASNRRLSSHLPIVAVVLIILALPIAMLMAILSQVASDLWLLVVVSSYVVTIVQVIGSLVTYALFMWDSFKPNPDQYMDEYVFYIKAATKGCELIMAVSIVSGGLYECFVSDDEFSLINIGILSVHCYFNIYQRIAAGWKTYLARRETKKRLSVLEDASGEELAANGDVCAICYSEMEAAKKTLCGHFFHSNCLKRWLFVQDNCPLCTAPIIEVKTEQDQELQPTQPGGARDELQPPQPGGAGDELQPPQPGGAVDELQPPPPPGEVGDELQGPRILHEVLEEQDEASIRDRNDTEHEDVVEPENYSPGEAEEPDGWGAAVTGETVTVEEDRGHQLPVLRRRNIADLFEGD